MKQLLTLVIQFLMNPTEETVEDQSVSKKNKMVVPSATYGYSINVLLSYFQGIPERFGLIDASQH